MTSKVTVEAMNGDVQVWVDEPGKDDIQTLDNGDVIDCHVYVTTKCVVKDGESRSWHVWKGGPTLRIEEKEDGPKE